MSSKSTPISKYSRIKIGITFGDPAGIGPLIIAKALKRIGRLAEFVVIGDRRVFDRVSLSAPAEHAKVKFVDLDNAYHKNFKFGKISASSGRASIEYLDKALELLKQRAIDCLVTGPISKIAINLAGYRYSGHTEYFAKNTGARNVEMMLLNQDLRFVLVTRHIAVKEVPQAINEKRIFQASLAAHRALQKLFLIKNPGIAVCSLNPHASDNGLMGNEESAIISPAIRELQRKIKNIDGPLPADVAVSEAQAGRYDCLIAMYHDQALIPLKLAGNNQGVNLTLGLDFIRTSPLHGTAFDIAGTDRASPDSLIAAIKLALKCTANLKKT